MLTSHHLQQRAASPVKCLSRCETKSQFLLLRPWSHNESWPLRQKCYAFVQLACVLNSYLAANGVAKLWPNMCFMVQTFYYQLVIVTWKYHDVNLDNLISSFLSPSYICEILKETSSRFRWSGSKNKPTTHSCLWPRGIKTSLKKLFFGHFPRKHELHKFWVRVWWLQVDVIYVRQIFYFIFFNNSSHNILHNWLHNLPPSDFVIWHLTVTLICSARHRDNHTQKISHYWK